MSVFCQFVAFLVMFGVLCLGLLRKVYISNNIQLNIQMKIQLNLLAFIMLYISYLGTVHISRSNIISKY